VIVILSIVFCLLVSGCGEDPLSQAEQLAANDNYIGVLDILKEIDVENQDKEHYHRLRALALFVEDRFDEGFGELKLLYDDPDSRETLDDAKIMLKAAAVIIREKDRYREAIILLDSSVSCDIEIKDEVLKLIWNRSLEYLSVPGAGGYYLTEFASGLDEKAPGKLKIKKSSALGIYGRTTKRLKRHRVLFYNRYQEMKKMHLNLSFLAKGIDAFRKVKGRLPRDLAELKMSGFNAGGEIWREGWRIQIIKGGDEGYQLTADALKNNPGEVLTGTTMIYHK